MRNQHQQSRVERPLRSAWPALTTARVTKRAATERMACIYAQALRLALADLGGDGDSPLEAVIEPVALAVNVGLRDTVAVAVADRDWDPLPDPDGLRVRVLVRDPDPVPLPVATDADSVPVAPDAVRDAVPLAPLRDALRVLEAAGRGREAGERRMGREGKNGAHKTRWES